MAFPTSVNSQITDSVTQDNTQPPSNTAPTSSGHIVETLSHESGETAQELTHHAAQQDTQGTTTKGVGILYSIDTAPDGAGAGKPPYRPGDDSKV